MKIHAIIQARMGSTRLPNKILMPVNGKPLLGWMLDRLSSSRSITDIIVATTTDNRDDPIEEYVLSEGWKVFRGSEHDVLDRYYRAAQAFSSDVILRLTSDCPLLDPAIVDRMVMEFLSRQCDFLSNSEPLPSSWPDGMDVSIFSFSALQEAALNAKKPSEREHVTFYFWNSPRNLKTYKVEHNPSLEKYRITLDYSEDFALIEKIIENLYADRDPRTAIHPSLNEIVEFLDRHPALFALNSMYHHGIGWAPSFERDAEQEAKGFQP